MAEKSLNIFQKINEIRKAVDYIQKDKIVPGGNYKAVTHDAVTGILRKHMIEHGVICVPSLVDSHSDPKEQGAKQALYRAQYKFDFINADKPDEMVSIVIEAHAMDNQDKAPGKAISYAKKYAVLKLFEIETGEDEESRYQTDGVEEINEMFAACTTLEQLQNAYKAEFVANQNNHRMLKEVTSLKDSHKRRIEKAIQEAA